MVAYRSQVNLGIINRGTEGTQVLQKSRRAVGVSPSVPCLGDHFFESRLISPKLILRTPRANVGQMENRRAYARRSPLGMQRPGKLESRIFRSCRGAHELMPVAHGMPP